MNRHSEIKNAYRSLGKEATFYDGMITCSTLPGRDILRLFLCEGRKPPHGLVYQQALHAQRIFHAAL